VRFSIVKNTRKKIGSIRTTISNTIQRIKSWGELHSFFDTILKDSVGKGTVASQLKEYRSWVHIAASVIYRRTSSVDFKYIRIDTGKEIKKDNPVYNTINRIFVDPNPYMEFRFIKQYLQLQLDLTGMAFALREDILVGGIKLPYRIWPLNVGNLVRIERGNNFRQWIKGFTFNIGGKYVFYDWDNVLYFHYPHPKDPRLASSPIQAQAYAIDLDHYIEVYERDFFKNSARPDFMLKFPEGVTISEEEAERLKAQWKGKFSGEGKYHEIGILDAGGDIVELTPKNEDLALMSLAGWTQSKILAAYNVPPGKVGMVKDVNRANALGIDITFNSEAIKPRLDLIDDVFTRSILQKFDPRIAMKHDNPIPRDRELDIKEIREKVGVPIWTINEGRDRDGLASVKGGDVIQVPLNFIPLLSAPDEPEDDSDGSPEDDSDGETRTAQQIEYKDTRYSDKWRTRRWNVFKIFTQRWESVWKTILSKLFEDQQEEVLQNLEKSGEKTTWYFSDKKNICENFDKQWNIYKDKYNGWSAKKLAADLIDNTEKIKSLVLKSDSELISLAIKGILKDVSKEQILMSVSDFFTTKQTETVDAILFDWDGNVSTFGKGSERLYRQVMENAGQEELNMLDVDFDFDVYNPAINSFLGEKVEEFSRNVLSSKADRLQRTLITGMEKGEGISQLSQRVKDVYKGTSLTGYDLERIARTEVVAASNAGQQFAYEQSEVVEEKEWLSTKDGRTRGANPDDRCNHFGMDRQRVPLDKPFVDSRCGARLMHPGDTSLGAGAAAVINCRCTMVPHTTKSQKNADDPNTTELRQFYKQTGLKGVGPSRASRQLRGCYD